MLASDQLEGNWEPGCCGFMPLDVDAGQQLKLERLWRDQRDQLVLGGSS